MCIVCMLLDKEKITKKEAKKALWEEITYAKSDDEVKHIQETYAKLDKEEKEPE